MTPNQKKSPSPNHMTVSSNSKTNQFDETGSKYSDNMSRTDSLSPSNSMANQAEFESTMSRKRKHENELDGGQEHGSAPKTLKLSKSNRNILNSNKNSQDHTNDFIKTINNVSSKTNTNTNANNKSMLFSIQNLSSSSSTSASSSMNSPLNLTNSKIGSSTPSTPSTQTPFQALQFMLNLNNLNYLNQFSKPIQQQATEQLETVHRDALDLSLPNRSRINSNATSAQNGLDMYSLMMMKSLSTNQSTSSTPSSVSPLSSISNISEPSIANNNSSKRYDNNDLDNENKDDKALNLVKSAYFHQSNKKQQSNLLMKRDEQKQKAYNHIQYQHQTNQQYNLINTLLNPASTQNCAPVNFSTSTQLSSPFLANTSLLTNPFASLLNPASILMGQNQNVNEQTVANASNMNQFFSNYLKMIGNFGGHQSYFQLNGKNSNSSASSTNNNANTTAAL